MHDLDTLTTAVIGTLFTDPDTPDPSPPPWDDKSRLDALYLLECGIDACTVCSGAHRPTQCPEVAEALHDSLPNPGRAIWRHFHSRPRHFLQTLAQLDPVIWRPLALHYARYSGRTVAEVLDMWLLGVQGTNLPASARQ